MTSLHAPYSRRSCPWDHNDGWAIGMTQGMVILSIANEIIVHTPTLARCCSIALPANSSTRGPPILLRGIRLIISSILLSIITTFFIVRLIKAYECDGPNTAVLILLNIAPLFMASASWGRALLDCVLAKAGATVPYPTRLWPLAKGHPGWPAAVPFYALYLIFALPLAALGVVSGDGEDGPTEEDAEEEIGLMEDVGSRKDEEMGSPPPYGRVQDEGDQDHGKITI